jgi:hypothetical protein
MLCMFHEIEWQILLKYDCCTWIRLEDLRTILASLVRPVTLVTGTLLDSNIRFAPACHFLPTHFLLSRLCGRQPSLFWEEHELESYRHSNRVPRYSLFDFLLPLSFCFPFSFSSHFDGSKFLTWLARLDIKHASCMLQVRCHFWKKFSYCCDTYEDKTDLCETNLIKSCRWHQYVSHFWGRVSLLFYISYF